MKLALKITITVMLFAIALLPISVPANWEWAVVVGVLSIGVGTILFFWGVIVFGILSIWNRNLARRLEDWVFGWPPDRSS